MVKNYIMVDYVCVKRYFINRYLIYLFRIISLVYVLYGYEMILRIFFDKFILYNDDIIKYLVIPLSIFFISILIGFKLNKEFKLNLEIKVLEDSIILLYDKFIEYHSPYKMYKQMYDIKYNDIKEIEIDKFNNIKISYSSAYKESYLLKRNGDINNKKYSLEVEKNNFIRLFLSNNNERRIVSEFINNITLNPNIKVIQVE